MKPEFKKVGSRPVRLTVAAAVASAILLAGSASALMQARTPYDKDRLLKVVKLNALSTQEVIQAVQQRGVDFQLTPGVETEFRAVGARPELIEALRTNYRPASSTSPSSSSASSSPAPRKPAASNVPAGPPLGKNEVITLLQSGVPAARVEQFVEVRGVSFLMTPEIAREITAAGGNRSLIGAITEKASGDSSSIATAPSRRPAGPDYDDLTDQAVSAMQASNAPYAIRLLQQAVTMDASRPTAYQLLGFAELYGRQDIFSAERAMRAAMERGGSGVFYVYHDHDGFFQTWCEGSFFVNKLTVSYKANDGNHTFEAPDSLIKEAALNGFVGAEYGAFHLKVREDVKDKSKTFNFAPATRKKAESNLIISLIKSYQ